MDPFDQISDPNDMIFLGKCAFEANKPKDFIKFLKQTIKLKIKKQKPIENYKKYNEKNNDLSWIIRKKECANKDILNEELRDMLYLNFMNEKKKILKSIKKIQISTSEISIPQ